MLQPFLVALLVFYNVSAFTIHQQHSGEPTCVDLQCPTTAFESGIKNLINEDTMRSDECKECEQCTANGYSLCLRAKSSRATRAGANGGGCSCAHSVPANCHNQISSSNKPANITMQLYSLCYLSSLQAPPRVLAVNEKASVIVTVEPFWHEPYWKQLHLDNLTLHYEFTVKVPEHCDGDVITSETDRAEHMCMNILKIEMNDHDGEKKEDEEYEHSENYDQYDDDLPPEVQFDRDVFAGAKLLKVFYTVDVRRPRQLESNTRSDPFSDVTSSLESEVLKFDLKPEIFGDGSLPEKKQEEEDEKDVMKGDSEDVSEEKGEGTDFFEEAVRKTEDDGEKEEEEDELEKKIASEEKKTEEEHKDEEIEEKEEKKEEGDDEKKEETEGEEDKEEDKEEAKEEEKEEEEKEEGEGKDGEEEEEETSTAAEEESFTENDVDSGETTTEGESEKQSGEESGEKEEVNDRDAAEVEGEEEDEEELSFFQYLLRGRYPHRFHIARTVFLLCIAGCLLLITVTCLYRRGCCCFGSKSSKTTANGYRYNNANRTTELVNMQPEKERLNQ